MGVNGLWTVVSPCARPIKIETLNKRRLAVDASIWIYQFLKAVRDKEGNALRNSHVVGFFRRICKLLYFGIKPVFVFDGGAPVLKRQTINARKSRREGRREDAVRTAGKLLALQMHRIAEEEEQKRKQKEAAPLLEDDEEPLPENLTYVEEIGVPQQERTTKKFKKKDQYHLPDLNVSISEMGAPNDPRVMSLEELEQYARQFESGEDINVYDFSKIDFDSPFFVSLPASDRYNILNAARLRSRLRMGYSKEQLDTMFPDRMAFSRFQIERVKERNELTQRLMNINGMGDAFDANFMGRVAGEKGREYVLVKNDGVEGGWALGVIGDKDKDRRDDPIDVDAINEKVNESEEEESEEDADDDFEDVPIEGLNRLPKLPKARRPAIKGVDVNSADILRQREALYNTRRDQAQQPRGKVTAVAKNDSLFVDQDTEEYSNMTGESGLFMEADDEDDQDLKRAIAMSLEPNHEGQSSPEEDDFEEVFQNIGNDRVAQSQSYFKNGSGSVAKLANSRSGKAAPPPKVFEDDSEDDDDDMDMGAALAKSNQIASTQLVPSSKKPKATPSKQTDSLFDGPLPFEKLDLGSSLLGRKKADKIKENSAGGFEKDLGVNKKKSNEPLPPWFSSGEVEKDLDAQKAIEDEDRHRMKDEEDKERFEFEMRPRLLKDQTSEIINIDVDDIKQDHEKPVILDINEDDINVANSTEKSPEIQMGDVAEMIRTNPPAPKDPQLTDLNSAQTEEDDKGDLEREISEWEASDTEPTANTTAEKQTLLHVGGIDDSNTEGSSSPEFENVQMPEAPSIQLANDVYDEEDSVPPSPYSGERKIHSSPMPDVGDVEEQEGEEYNMSDSEEELFMQLATEAEEHARFASTLNQKTQEQNIAEYERELKALRTQQKKDRRDADEVTQVMITECQQLLSLFGLPYITAPMEAEAQCAELVSLGLVDGIVTDDSDIFLFGGTRVYKNMFNQAKFVECYLLSDLEREFDLTRERLIRIAHLLGSDYTEGLPGVGPVTALEIISEFPGGLADFKNWWNSIQQGLRTADNADEMSTEQTDSAWRRKFARSQTTKLFLSPVFPDQRVDQAYFHPEVDSNPQQFQWGVPDLDRLRAYLMATIGWSQDRTDEVLVPVIKDMNRRENEGTQSNITSFLGNAAGGSAAVGAGAFAPRKKEQGKSRRMETALEKMAARARTKRKGGTGAIGGNPRGVTPQLPSENNDKDANGEIDEDEDHDDEFVPSRNQKGGNKRRKKAKRMGT